MNRIYLLLAMLLCNVICFSQWVSDPSINNHITRTPYEDYLIEAFSDGSNGAIFICSDQSGDGNVYVQKINSVGQIQWNSILAPLNVINTNDNKLTMTAIADGSGGAYIAWSDYRNNQFNGEIYIQRINGSGIALWTAGGVRVTSTNNNDDFFPVLNLDGAGGIFVGWVMDSDNANQIQSYVQKYNGSGTVQWTANGVQLSTAPGFRVISSLIKDGTGGVFAIFDDTRNDPDGLDYDYISNGNLLTNIDIYGQHLSSTGAVLWTANALIMANGFGNQSELKAGMVEDGSGGFMFAYSDGRNDDGSFNNIDVFAQRMNSSGAAQWGVGLPVTTASFNQSLYKTIPDGAGGMAICIYEEFSGGVAAQRLSNAGVRIWATDGVPASPVDEFVFAVDMLMDASGNLVIGSNTGSVNTIVAQKFDPAGIPQWGAGTKIICNAANSSANSLNLVLSDNGSIITGWTDFRNSLHGVLADVFCSKILADGTTAGFPAYITVANGTWENPATWTGNISPNHGVPIIVRHSTTAASNIICGTLSVESGSGNLTTLPAARLLLLK